MLNIDFHYDNNIRIDNIRVGGIILRDGYVLLMYRNKNGREFYTFPGGHMRQGEDQLNTLKREILEETSLSIMDIKPAFTLADYAKDKVDYYYTATCELGEATLGGEESVKNAPGNMYRLEWFKLVDINNLYILPKAAKEWVEETLND